MQKHTAGDNASQKTMPSNCGADRHGTSTAKPAQCHMQQLQGSLPGFRLAQLRHMSPLTAFHRTIIVTTLRSVPRQAL
jgi:hypothetical protein